MAGSSSHVVLFRFGQASAQGAGSPYTAENWCCCCLGGASSRRAWTVTATWLKPFSSKMWRGKHNCSWGTPIFLQASRKFSTFRLHFAIVNLGTAGEGTWILGTDRGRTWLAKWQRTTPSVRAAPRSQGRDTFNRYSICFRSWSINSSSSSLCLEFCLATESAESVVGAVDGRRDEVWPLFVSPLTAPRKRKLSGRWGWFLWIAAGKEYAGEWWTVSVAGELDTALDLSSFCGDTTEIYQ